jgi:hypothetical protein
MEGLLEPPNIEDLSAACAHGVSKNNVCESCLQESISVQPVWKLLPEIQKQSKYTRSGENMPECTIERDGKKYEIKLVRPEDEEIIQEIQKLSEEAFGEEEVDPVEILKMGIQGKEPDGTQDISRYRLYVARDESGKIQSVYAGGLVEMRTKNKEPNGEMTFMSAYGITRPESQRHGLMRELYVSSMMQAATDALAQDKKFNMVAAEATGTSEKSWNAVGHRRVYVETGPNEYTELKYVQPALDFDFNTGLPTEDAGEFPEHLMVQFVEGEPDKDRIKAAVDGMYRWNNLYDQDAFTSAEAFNQHKHYIAEIQKKFNDQLSTSSPLHLLSAEEREVLKNKGITIHEYTEADGGEEEE